MNKIQTSVSILVSLAMVLMAPDHGLAKNHKKKHRQETPAKADSTMMKKDRVGRDFRNADRDGDGQLSKVEWNRRGNFERLDKNGDGALTLTEVRALYAGHDKKNYNWPPTGMKTPVVDIDPTVKTDRVGSDALDKETLCGIGRGKKCDIAHQKARGLVETGTGPRFPNNVLCPGIDDYWAMDYSSKRGRAAFHGGIDIPVPWGTPMRAAAAGSVVTMYEASKSKRGNEVVLRHSPSQTGLPMWTYTAYGHLDALPDFKIGQRVNMGQVIGPTGNSGIAAMGKKGSGQSTTRRPAIHFVVFYSNTNTYSESNNTIIPVGGYWQDPMSFYRQKGPFDTPSVKALADSEKAVSIPVLLTDGTTIPADTKVVWPYACRRGG